MVGMIKSSKFQDILVKLLSILSLIFIYQYSALIIYTSIFNKLTAIQVQISPHLLKIAENAIQIEKNLCWSIYTWNLPDPQQESCFSESCSLKLSEIIRS